MEKNKAHHPTNRDERHSFRGTTRNSPKMAQLKSAYTLAVVNGTTRLTLLACAFRQQLVGESLIPYPKRLTPFRSRCVGVVDIRQPSLGC